MPEKNETAAELRRRLRFSPISIEDIDENKPLAMPILDAHSNILLDSGIVVDTKKKQALAKRNIREVFVRRIAEETSPAPAFRFQKRIAEKKTSLSKKSSRQPIPILAAHRLARPGNGSFLAPITFFAKKTTRCRVGKNYDEACEMENSL